MPQDTRRPAQSDVVSARTRIRRRHRLCRPGQRGRERQRRRALRLLAAVGHRHCERDGRSRAIPVGKARAGDRALAAGGHRSAAEPPGPTGLLGAGRDRRDGHRRRRGDRRGDRPAHPVPPAAAARRSDHRGGVAAASTYSGSARPATVRTRHHRTAAAHRDRVHRQLLRGNTTTGGRGRRPGAPIPREGKRAAGRGHLGRDGDAARGLSALRTWPATDTAIPIPARAGVGSCVPPGWMSGWRWWSRVG